MTQVLDEHGSARLTQIRDALTELFLAEGFRGVGLDRMTAHAQCSKSTLYELAESKEQLIVFCVEYYFRRAAQRVEAAVAAEPDPLQRVRTYLVGISAELGDASEAFLSDVAARSATRGSYERHTAIAGSRVRDLVADAVSHLSGDGVRLRFIGELAAAGMDAIERGNITARTGLSHAQAYTELAEVVLAAVRP